MALKEFLQACRSYNNDVGFKIHPKFAVINREQIIYIYNNTFLQCIYLLKLAITYPLSYKIDSKARDLPQLSSWVKIIWLEGGFDSKAGGWRGLTNTRLLLTLKLLVSHVWHCYFLKKRNFVLFPVEQTGKILCQSVLTLRKDHINCLELLFPMSDFLSGDMRSIGNKFGLKL